MESLLRINSKLFQHYENVINESLPSRNYSELSVDQRQELFTYVDSSSDDFRLTTNDVLHQLKKIKKNRSPGLDGMTEHLNSIFLGNRDDAYKKEN